MQNITKRFVPDPYISFSAILLINFNCLFQEILQKLFAVFDNRQEQKLNQDAWIEFLKSRLNQFDNETPPAHLYVSSLHFHSF
jgi:hypothetical protein